MGSASYSARLARLRSPQQRTRSPLHCSSLQPSPYHSDVGMSGMWRRPRERLGQQLNQALGGHSISDTGGTVVLSVLGYVGSLVSDQRPSVLQLGPPEHNTF